MNFWVFSYVQLRIAPEKDRKNWSRIHGRAVHYDQGFKYPKTGQHNPDPTRKGTLRDASDRKKRVKEAVSVPVMESAGYKSYFT
jgi:hypothetical protein